MLQNFKMYLHPHHPHLLFLAVCRLLFSACCEREFISLNLYSFSSVQILRLWIWEWTGWYWILMISFKGNMFDAKANNDISINKIYSVRFFSHPKLTMLSASKLQKNPQNYVIALQSIYQRHCWNNYTVFWTSSINVCQINKTSYLSATSVKTIKKNKWVRSV